MNNSNLEDAKRMIKIADHMIYVTFPILKENRLLIRILEQINNAIFTIVNTIMQHEYAYKRIKIYNDTRINLETFESKCAVRYGIAKEYIEGIKQVLLLMEKHKKSPMEFVRQNKFIIMSENLETDNVTVDRLKFFLAIAKDLLKKADMTITSDKSYF
jgi:hypothetical protein